MNIKIETFYYNIILYLLNPNEYNIMTILKENTLSDFRIDYTWHVEN